jgi:hypothetical protein
VQALHREYPQLTYDVTIKVEHLLKNADLLGMLRKTGCLFVVSAVESLDDITLQKLKKDHTRADFFRVVEECRRADITLQPTFVPFTPWTTFEQYLDLFEQLNRLELSEAVAPIQLGIRLLIPPSSKLFELEEIRKLVGPFDPQALVYPWKNDNPAVDALAEEVQEIVAGSEKLNRNRSATFERLWRTAKLAAGRSVRESPLPPVGSRATVPYLNEPWYC